MAIGLFLISVAVIAVTGVPVPEPQVTFGFITITPDSLLTIDDNISNLVCANMLPIHGDNQPQTSEAPYKIKLSTLVVAPQGIVKVEVESKYGNDTIRGVYIQARNSSDDAVGEFQATNNSNVIIADCPRGHNNSLLYVSYEATNRLQFCWEAPDDQKEVTFYVTFVETFSIFWRPITSDKVNITNQ